MLDVLSRADWQHVAAAQQSQIESLGADIVRLQAALRQATTEREQQASIMHRARQREREEREHTLVSSRKPNFILRKLLLAMAAIKIQTRFRRTRDARAMKQVHVAHVGLLSAAQLENVQKRLDARAVAVRSNDPPPRIFITHNSWYQGASKLFRVSRIPGKDKGFNILSVRITDSGPKSEREYLGLNTASPVAYAPRCSPGPMIHHSGAVIVHFRINMILVLNFGK